MDSSVDSSSTMLDARPPVTVLHVEDDRELGDAVRTLLGLSGYDVVTATHGDEAVQHVLVNGLRPDVLIVDYMLGEEETGSDVAEHIARIVGFPIATILLSADIVNAEVPWMPGAPILLVSKPFDPAALIDTIEHFAALQRAARQRSLHSGTAHS